MKRRFLPRLPGTSRDVAITRVEHEIEAELDYLAKLHNCSRSFVMNTILANALNIKVKARYYDYTKVARRIKKTA